MLHDILLTAAWVAERTLIGLIPIIIGGIVFFGIHSHDVLTRKRDKKKYVNSMR